MNATKKSHTWMCCTITTYPNGKNSRLLDRTDRVEFDRKTIEGNTGFQLEIPYLEYTFGTKILHHGQSYRWYDGNL